MAADREKARMVAEVFVDCVICFATIRREVAADHQHWHQILASPRRNVYLTSRRGKTDGESE